MKKIILIVLLGLFIQTAYSDDTEREEKPKQLESQPVISKSEALHIAHQDASRMYRDLNQYEVTAVLKEGNWQVDYELVVPKGTVMVGGGPHYLISGSSGEIVNRRYEQ